MELNIERPVCPRDGSHFVPGRGPICPGDGSCLSRRPSRQKCLCLLVFFLPDSSVPTQPPRTQTCQRPWNSGWRKRGVEFEGGSRHDRNRHNCRQNRQKPSRSALGTALCRTSKTRARCSPEPPKPSWRLPPLNSTPLFRHPEKWRLLLHHWEAKIALITTTKLPCKPIPPKFKRTAWVASWDLSRFMVVVVQVPLRSLWFYSSHSPPSIPPGVTVQGPLKKFWRKPCATLLKNCTEPKRVGRKTCQRAKLREDGPVETTFLGALKADKKKNHRKFTRTSGENLRKTPTKRRSSRELLCVFFFLSAFAPPDFLETLRNPEGPNLEKFLKIARRDWNFQARLKRMTFSSEIENFKRATHQTPIFVGEFSRSRLKISSENLKFSSGKLENFKRKLEIFKRSSEIGFFQDSGSLGSYFWGA